VIRGILPEIWVNPNMSTPTSKPAAKKVCKPKPTSMEIPERPSVITRDRIHVVLSELEKKHGFVCRTNWGCCAVSGALELQHCYPGKEYVFYHKVDAESAFSESGEMIADLWLVWNSPDPGLIVWIFKQAGFTAIWNGNYNCRICIKKKPHSAVLHNPPMPPKPKPTCK